MLEKIDSLRPYWLTNNCIILGVALLVGCYNYATWNFGIFKRLGIKGPKPLPVLGNLLDIQSMGLLKYDLEMKKKYGPIIGCFFGKTPTLVIHDVKLLKRILIKDFHLFQNRLDFGLASPPLDKVVVFLKDDHWKHVRSILTPTFSSGKMRKISPHLIQCCNVLCDNLSIKADSGETFDFRELCGAYAMDVIASTAFGIRVDSHNDPENEFVKKANKLFKFELDGPMLLFMFSPTLYKLLEKFGFSVTDKSTNDFFIQAVGQAAKERQTESENKQIDFLQIMVTAHLDSEESENHDEADSGSGKIKKGLTNDELLAQGFIFFLAGFENIANILSLFVYNMALYPEIQEKLYSEIIERLGEKEEPTYDFVKDLEYLEMCFTETLRMYPAAPRTDRVADKDVNIDGTFIPKGMAVIIPIQALQNDPDYWEDPEVFNPERFAPSQKCKIEPLRFMPFGTGPRNCIGMRLAMLELKMAIIKIIRKFKFLPSSKIEIPLTFEFLNMRPKNGILIQIEKRN